MIFVCLTTKKINIAIIGVGRLGSLHSKVISEISNANFVGVYDLDRTKSQQIANEFNVKCFDTLEEIPKLIDAVVVTTETSSHFEIAKFFLENHIHTFIEKPITKEISEAIQLIEIAKKFNLKIQVGHIERFNPAILALEKYNLSPMFIEAHRLSQFSIRGNDVAVVLDLMIHDIDLILSIVKSKVKRIDASGVKIISDTIDIANARINFENGAVANITASRISQRKMRKMRLFQRNGYFSIDFAENDVEVFRIVESENETQNKMLLLGEIELGKIKRNIVYERPDIPKINSLKLEVEEFLKSITFNTDVKVSGLDGLYALQIADEIVKKIETQNFF